MDRNYLITIIAPKGTKGIAISEDEFSFNLDQKYQVIDIDHTAQTATIMLIKEK